MKKAPHVQCYDCRKDMVETFRKAETIKMNCPDRCKGQPELTLKEMGPFWDNITNQKEAL